MNQLISAFLSLSLITTVGAYAQGFDRGFADLVKKTGNGVVNISTYTKQKIQMNPGTPNDDMFRRFFEEFFGGRMEEGRPPQAKRIPKKFEKSIPLALGTGFVIDAADGLILTNNHVIQNAEEVKIQFVEEDTDLIPAEVIGRDPELDVALLKVKTKAKLTAISLGDSDAIDVGEYVVAIGNPLGYGHTVSHGIISAKGRRNPEFRLGKYLQTDASINPGNSGGPLLNMKGEVIGINNAIDARAQGIGFAIPINMVKTILPQLKTKGAVSRGYLGVSAGDLTPETIEQLKLDPKTHGVLIVDLVKNQPADLAGIKPFDVITSVNGVRVMNAQDLTSQVTSIPVGAIAKVVYLRQGKEKSVEVKVTERPTDGVVQTQKKRKPMIPKKTNENEVYEEYGFSAENLNEQNARIFGIPASALQNEARVVVTELDYDKPAVNSGLNRGDIILDVTKEGNNYAVKNVADLAKKLKEADGQSVMLRVKRYGPQGDGVVSLVVLTK